MRPSLFEVQLGSFNPRIGELVGVSLAPAGFLIFTRRGLARFREAVQYSLSQPRCRYPGSKYFFPIYPESFQ